MTCLCFVALSDLAYMRRWLQGNCKGLEFTMDRLSAIIAACVLAIGVGAGGSLWLMTRSENICAGGNIAGADIGGAFALIDQTGQPVTDTDVITGPSLVYFGYTYCPDVCPFDVARNVEAVTLLEAEGELVTPIFVTVDPARDTVDALADYAEAMHPRMIALTGSDADIKAAADKYRVVYQKAGEGDQDYLVDHTTFSYLVGPEGFIGFFRRDMTAKQMADEISCLTDL